MRALLVKQDALGAAVLTAALVGLKLGGPLGALIGAGSVNYFGKKTATKGITPIVVVITSSEWSYQ